MSTVQHDFPLPGWRCESTAGTQRLFRDGDARPAVTLTASGSEYATATVKVGDRGAVLALSALLAGAARG